MRIIVAAECFAVSVILPCYNEEKNIEGVLRHSSEALRDIAVDFELIVVNDGSTDDTGNILGAVAHEDPHVTVISHPENRGYGAALKTGAGKALMPWILFMDSDGQFDISDIAKFLPYTKRESIIVGYRIRRRDPWRRRVNAFLFNRLVRLAFGLKVRDLNCAFKLWRAHVMRNVWPRADGAFINAEMLIRAQRAGVGFVEVGVNHFPRLSGAATGAKVRVIARAFREFFSLFSSLRRP